MTGTDSDFNSTFQDAGAAFSRLGEVGNDPLVRLCKVVLAALTKLIGAETLQSLAKLHDEHPEKFDQVLKSISEPEKDEHLERYVDPSRTRVSMDEIVENVQFDDERNMVFWRGFRIDLWRGPEYRVFRALLECYGNVTPYRLLHKRVGHPKEKESANAITPLRSVITQIRRALRHTDESFTLCVEPSQGYQLVFYAKQSEDDDLQVSSSASS